MYPSDILFADAISQVHTYSLSCFVISSKRVHSEEYSTVPEIQSSKGPPAIEI